MTRQRERAKERRDVEHTAGEQAARRVYFAFGVRNFIAAGALLLGTVLFVVLVPYLFWEEPPQGALPLHGKRVLALGAVFLLAELFVFLRFRFSLRTTRLLSYAFLLMAPFFAFAAVDLINGTNFLLWFQPGTLRPRKLVGNYICYLFLFLLLYALFRSVFAAIAAGGTVFLLFGIANYFTSAFRGSPILPWDLTAVGTAADVLGGYELRLTGRMALFLFLFGLFLCIVFAFCGAKPLPAGRAWNLGERGAALASSVLLLVLLLPCNILTHLNIEVYPWNQLSSMQISGVMPGFLVNANYLLVDKPEGYSAQRAGEIAEQAKQAEEPAPLGSPSGLPTIITVMNESLVDFTKAGDLEYTEDYLPYLHSLEASGEVIWGSAYAPIFGGGTCNSEYEFLTGNTTGFLPVGSRAYQQYVTEPQPSIVKALEGLGYQGIAVHPGQRKAWQRDTAYPNLGFEKFVDAGSFTVERDFLRGYTTDESNYEQVIWEYENRDPDKNLFLFDVTIQNHGGYADPDFETTVRLKKEPGKYPQAEQYLSIAKVSDEAFRDLTAYFQQVDEPVVILMFGDHWPRLEDGFYSELLGADVSSLSFEDTLRMYEVPFIIWANYPLEGQELDTTSLNYLSGVLFRAAGLECTGYQKFGEQAGQTLPVVTALGCRDANGAWYRTGEESPYSGLLQEYEILQYNNIFDKKGRLTDFFTLAP